MRPLSCCAISAAQPASNLLATVPGVTNADETVAITPVRSSQPSGELVCARR